MKIAGSRSVSQRYGSEDPDPYQNVTGSEILLTKYIHEDEPFKAKHTLPISLKKTKKFVNIT
jgi:hypothetical protein